MSRRVLFRVLLTSALLLVPAGAVGYGVLLHNLIPTRTLANDLSLANTPVRTTNLTGVTDADLARFRGWIYTQARALPDTAVRNAFNRRYPAATDFDARAFKEFLMLNPAARVLGIDSFASVYEARTAADARLDPFPAYASGRQIPLSQALALGSIYARLDRRHYDRMLRTADGSPALSARGDTVPWDPVTLNMGRLTGPTSANHARFGLNHMPKSANTDVLQSAPANYAIPLYFEGPVETFAEQNAQVYTDLALLALIEGGSGMEALSALYAGMAMHYVAGVADPIYTVQMGTPTIENDVMLARLFRQITTVFGLFGRVPSRTDYYVNILANLRSLSEKVLQVQLTQALTNAAQGNTDAIPPGLADAPEALTRGDTTLHIGYHALVNSSRAENQYAPFGRLLTAAVVDESYQDGVDAYRLTRAMATTKLRRASVRVDFDTIPDEEVWNFVGSRASETTRRALRRLNTLQTRAIRRANEAVQGWWYGYGLSGIIQPARRNDARNAYLGRLVAGQLQYLDEAEGRRARWLELHGGIAQ